MLSPFLFLPAETLVNGYLTKSWTINKVIPWQDYVLKYLHFLHYTSFYNTITSEIMGWGLRKGRCVISEVSLLIFPETE